MGKRPWPLYFFPCCPKAWPRIGESSVVPLLFTLVGKNGKAAVAFSSLAGYRGQAQNEKSSWYFIFTTEFLCDAEMGGGGGCCDGLIGLFSFWGRPGTEMGRSQGAYPLLRNQV